MLKLKLINSPKPLKIKFSYNFPDVLPVVLEEKTITPKIVDQIIIPSSNYDGMSQVTVKAVDSTIDKNIKSENIKKDVSILGVHGNVEELNGTKLEITKNGTYTPEEPYNGFTEVDVNTDSVDEYFTNTISNGTGNYEMSGWIKTIKKLPNYIINGINATYMFSSSLLTSIPQLDTSKVTNMNSMCYNCSKLTSIPQLDASNVTNISTVVSYSTYITYLGGFQNLGQAYFTSVAANYGIYTLNLNSCTRLTHDSLMNVINNLYDIASKGVKTQRLTLGSTNVAKLTADEIAIATNKGWTVS